MKTRSEYNMAVDNTTKSYGNAINKLYREIETLEYTRDSLLSDLETEAMENGIDEI